MTGFTVKGRMSPDQFEAFTRQNPGRLPPPAQMPRAEFLRNAGNPAAGKADMPREIDLPERRPEFEEPVAPAVQQSQGFTIKSLPKDRGNEPKVLTEDPTFQSIFKGVQRVIDDTTQLISLGTFDDFEGGVLALGAKALGDDRPFVEIYREKLANVQRRVRGPDARTEVEAAVELIPQGVTARLSDEAEGAIRAIIAKTAGDERSFEELFNENVEIPRERIRIAQEAQPVAAGIGELAGAVALPSGIAARGVATGLQGVRQGFKAGAVQGAAFGFGGAEDGLKNRLIGAGVGAATGGVAGGMLGTFAARAAAPKLPEGAIRDAQGKLRNAQGHFIAEPRKPGGLNEVSVAAENRGVALPVGIAAENQLVQDTFQAARQIPGVNIPLERAVRESTDDLEFAVERAARGRRGVKTNLTFQEADTVGAGTREALEEFVESESRRADAAFGSLRGAIRADDAVPVADDITRKLNFILRKRAGRGANQISAQLEAPINVLRRPGGSSFNDLQGARADLSKAIKFDVRQGGGFDQGDMKRIRGLLTEQMKRAVRTTATVPTKKAERLLSIANKTFGEVADDAAAVGRLLRQESDNKLATQVLTLAQKRGDTNRLLRLKSSMSPKQWKTLSAFTIFNMGRNRANEFSPTFFYNSYNGMTSKAKAALFGQSSTQTGKAIEEIALIAERMKRVSGRANTSNTARAALTAAGVGGAGFALVDPLSAMSTAMQAGAVAIPLALLLTRRPTAASAARWSKAYERFVRQPSRATRRGLEVASRVHAERIGTEFGLRDQINELTDHFSNPALLTSQGAQ